MQRSNTTTSAKATDMIAGICAFPRLPCPSTKRHVFVMLNLTSAAATALRTAGWSCSVFVFFLFELSCERYMVMDVVVQNPQKSSGYDQGATTRKNMWVMTPRCSAAAVVSAVVLRRLTKEHTHPYSMMHRRLPTAGIEVALHYRQLLVPSTGLAVLFPQAYFSMGFVPFLFCCDWDRIIYLFFQIQRRWIA